MLGTTFGSYLPSVEFGDLEIKGWRFCTLSKKHWHIFTQRQASWIRNNGSSLTLASSKLLFNESNSHMEFVAQFPNHINIDASYDFLHRSTNRCTNEFDHGDNIFDNGTSKLEFHPGLLRWRFGSYWILGVLLHKRSWYRGIRTAEERCTG